MVTVTDPLPLPLTDGGFEGREGRIGRGPTPPALDGGVRVLLETPLQLVAGLEKREGKEA
jgi:hypothetical protein